MNRLRLGVNIDHVATIRNARGEWVDQEVVRDANLLTSRKPDDLPAFIRESMRLVAESRHAQVADAGPGT